MSFQLRSIPSELRQSAVRPVRIEARHKLAAPFFLDRRNRSRPSGQRCTNISNKTRDSMIKISLYVTIGCLSLGCGSTNESTSTSRFDAPKENRNTVAAVSIQEISGVEQLRQFSGTKQGKIVVVDYWATWCPPCVAEFPQLVKLHQQHSANVTCVSVSCDHEGLDELSVARTRVREFLMRQGATFDNLLATIETDVFFRQLGIASVPTVEVYGTDGALIQRFDASTTQGDLYQGVNQLVDRLLVQ